MVNQAPAAAIVIGGTGMLAKATRWLTSHSTTTLVVARRASLFAAGHTNMIAVNSDWNEAGIVKLIGRGAAGVAVID
jgi:hypothetical protein